MLVGTDPFKVGQVRFFNVMLSERIMSRMLLNL
jgi:hypothetical protein